MKFRYIRLFADAAGESHFEDVESQLSPFGSVPNAPPLYLSSTIKAEQVGFFGAKSGWTGDWHVSATRSLFVLLTGVWEIEASDGETRLIRPGDTLLVEDTKGRGHRSRVSSEDESLAVMIQVEE